MSATRIWLGGTEVTAHIAAEDWPEWLETSMKGAGFFDWEVKPFKFRLLSRCPVVVEYGMPVRIDISEATRFTGVVTETEDEFSDAPLITCQPAAATLKDVMAGPSAFDTSAGALSYILSIPSPGVSLQAAAEAVLAHYSDNRDERLQPDGVWTVEVLDPEGDPVQDVFGPRGCVGPEPPADGTMAGPYRFPWVENDPPDGFDPPAIPIEYWLDVRQTAAGSVRIYQVQSRYHFEGHETIPEFAYTEPFDDLPSNWSVPWIYAEQNPDGSGVLETISLEEWMSLDRVGWWTSRVDRDLASRYIRFLLNLPESHAVTPWAAINANIGDRLAAWTFVKVSGNLYVTFWTEPTVKEISGRWANTDMGTILKAFAAVTGRWMRIEGMHVTFARRLSAAGEVFLPSFDTCIDRDRQRAADRPGQISIEIRDTTDPESTGIDIPRGLINAINWWYVDRFSGQTVTTRATWPIAQLPEGTSLLAAAPSAGQLVGLDWSTDGDQWRIRAIQEGQ